MQPDDTDDLDQAAEPEELPAEDVPFQYEAVECDMTAPDGAA